MNEAGQVEAARSSRNPTYTVMCGYWVGRGKQKTRAIARGLDWQMASDLALSKQEQERRKHPEKLTSWTLRIFWRQREKSLA